MDMKATRFIDRHAWKASYKNADAIKLANQFTFDEAILKNRHKRLINALEEVQREIEFILDTVKFIEESALYRQSSSADRVLLGEVEEPELPNIAKNTSTTASGKQTYGN